MQLVFATSNENKVKEIRSILPEGMEVKSLRDIGFEGELEETRGTISGNSLQKAEYLSEHFKVACFAEDTGLEIDALGGKPGVYSARYAGEKASYQDNVSKVLKEMEGLQNRLARFVTVITYYNAGKYVQFEGICEGEILREERGIEGFGYDPIFIPLGCNHSFAEMRLEEKNLYSHRKKAFAQFLEFLKSKPEP